MTNVDRDPELEAMHRSKKPLWVALAIVAALVVLVAALGPSIRAAFTGSETAASAEYNDTDVHFLGMMVPHHEQAIEMSDVLLASDVDDPQVRDLAQRIKDGQEAENEQMRAWADEWGVQEDMEHHSRHIANGMFTPAQLDEFATLRGDELRTTFLEWMHHHHKYVIDMTQGEVTSGAYQPLREMGQQMIDVQTTEMAEMEQILGYEPDLTQ